MWQWIQILIYFILRNKDSSDQSRVPADPFNLEGISKQRNKWSLPSASPPSTKGCDCEGPAGLAARGGEVNDLGPGWPPPASAHAWVTFLGTLIQSYYFAYFVMKYRHISINWAFLLLCSRELNIRSIMNCMTCN